MPQPALQVHRPVLRCPSRRGAGPPCWGPWALTPPLPAAGTGTFGRVQLVREKKSTRFFALKVMRIPDVIRLKQEQHVHNEKSVLKEVSHAFLVKL